MPEARPPISEIGVTWDIRPCIVCGEIHERHTTENGFLTWKAADGHAYAPKSWRQAAIEWWRTAND